jgi:acyl-CoA synthetase (AMP-forming)/AMP-acid ligase II
MDVRTLNQALAHTARTRPERGIAIYDRRGRNAERRTYPELVELARQRAGRLAASGVTPGDRILLAMPTSWELLETFFGALELGAYPVMVAPPGALGSAGTYQAKIDRLMKLMEPTRIVCDAGMRDQLRDGDTISAALRATITPTELGALAPVRYPECSRENGLAFIQLTSGSTGSQRGVQVSHANALHNTRAIADCVNCQPEDVVVSWLPLNHDMGLVGCLLFSMVNGLDLWLLRPETFLARPLLWLSTISSRRGTFSAAPNFAYQLCVDRIDAEDLAGLNLSSWRGALTGAEMIRPVTCAAFEKKFSGIGFKPQFWQPCYGMAECTLAATADRRKAGLRSALIDNRGAELAHDVVCTGEALLDTTVRVSSIDTPGQFLPDGSIGEVYIQGPGVFSGYYRDPEATASAMQDGWLRTGDLGFMKDSELYITGRLKDLLIINGHNWMPHELEWEADIATGGGGADRSGAFSVLDGSEGEKPVVVVELTSSENQSLAEVEHAIRSRIGRVLGLPLKDVVLVKRGQIPKTSSGKVQRGELRRRYIAGELQRLS